MYFKEIPTYQRNFTVSGICGCSPDGEIKIVKYNSISKSEGTECVLIPVLAFLHFCI